MSDAFEIWLSFLDEGGDSLLRAWLVEEGLEDGLLVLKALVQSSIEGVFDCSLCSDDRVLGFGGDCVYYFVDFCLEAFSGEKVGDVEAMGFLGVDGKASQNHPLCYLFTDYPWKGLCSTHSRNQSECYLRQPEAGLFRTEDNVTE